MKNRFRTSAVLMILLLAAMATGMIIRSMVKLREKELQWKLKQNAARYDKMESSALPDKYRALVALQHRNDATPEMLEEEARRQVALFHGEISGKPGISDGWEWISLRLFNLLNLLSGAPALHFEPVRRDELLLEFAYMKERQRLFPEAEAAYTALIACRDLPEESEIFARLHRGFLRLLLEKYPGAEADFRAAADQKRDADIAAAAREFLEILRVKKKNPSDLSLAGGWNMFRRGRPAVAAAIGKRNGKTGEAAYLTGRGLEEVGLGDLALRQYREIADGDGGLEFRKKSNRRLYMMNSFYLFDFTAAEAARRRLSELKDEKSIRHVEHFSLLMREVMKTVPEERLKKTGLPLRNEIDGEMTRFRDYLSGLLKTATPLPGEKNSALITNSGRVLIKTLDGTEYRGVIIKDSKVQITLMTDFGRVNIPKQFIVSTKPLQ